MSPDPLGSLRLQRSQDALRRQKNCASAAFRNISATLENFRKPADRHFLCELE